MGTVEHLAKCIEQDLTAMFPAMFKSPREKMAIMIAALIEARSCNTMELAARLPIATERAASRFLRPIPQNPLSIKNHGVVRKITSFLDS